MENMIKAHLVSPGFVLFLGDGSPDEDPEERRFFLGCPSRVFMSSLLKGNGAALARDECSSSESSSDSDMITVLDTLLAPRPNGGDLVPELVSTSIGNACGFFVTVRPETLVDEAFPAPRPEDEDLAIGYACGFFGTTLSLGSTSIGYLCGFADFLRSPRSEGGVPDDVLGGDRVGNDWSRIRSESSSSSREEGLLKDESGPRGNGAGARVLEAVRVALTGLGRGLVGGGDTDVSLLIDEEVALAALAVLGRALGGGARGGDEKMSFSMVDRFDWDCGLSTDTPFVVAVPPCVLLTLFFGILGSFLIASDLALMSEG